MELMAHAKFFSFKSWFDVFVAAMLVAISITIWGTDTQFPLFFTAVLVLLAWMAMRASPGKNARVHRRAMYLVVALLIGSGLFAIAALLGHVLRGSGALQVGGQWILVAVGLWLVRRACSTTIRTAWQSLSRREGVLLGLQKTAQLFVKRVRAGLAAVRSSQGG